MIKVGLFGDAAPSDAVAEGAGVVSAKVACGKVIANTELAKRKLHILLIRTRTRTNSHVNSTGRQTILPVDSGSVLVPTLMKGHDR